MTVSGTDNGDFLSKRVILDDKTRSAVTDYLNNPIWVSFTSASVPLGEPSPETKTDSFMPTQNEAEALANSTLGFKWDPE